MEIQMQDSLLNRRNLVAGTIATGAAALATTQMQRASAQTAPAGDKLAEILARGKLIVGTGNDIPPFYFTDKSGALTGMEIDLARLLAKGLFNDSNTVEFVAQTSDARIPNILSGRVDVTIQNLTVTAARAQQVEFSVPYYRAGQGFMLRTNGKYKTFDDLKAAGSAATISAIQNVFVEGWVRSALPQAKVEQFPGADAALQALNASRVDAQFITHSRIVWTVKEAPDRYLDSGYSFRANSVACAIRPGEGRLLNWLNTALREAMNGVDFEEYAAIFKKWLDVSIPNPKTGYPHEFNT
jgi:polar amino acid transport system substrate-binding protein